MHREAVHDSRVALMPGGEEVKPHCNDLTGELGIFLSIMPWSQFNDFNT